MSVAILKNIVLVLLGFSVIWFVRVLVKRETENFGRAIIVCLLLGAVFFYLQHVKLEKLTFADIRAQVKETFYPEKMPNYIFHKDEGMEGSRSYIRYFFESPGPRLSLDFDPGQKYFHIKDIHSVNRILDYLGLPGVTRPVHELASITGSANDINIYRWEDYELGVLTIERAICQDHDRLESYACIVNITILRK
jgi:hypothetical protein